jgi:hypothetical protein
MSQNNQGLNSILGTLVMLSRYDIDGSTKGGSCWMLTDPDEDNEDVLGMGVLKIAMPYEMFEQQKSRVEANDYNLPCQAEVYYKTVMGGGNKPKLKAVSIRPLVLNNAAPVPTPTPTAMDSKPENKSTANDKPQTK